MPWSSDAELPKEWSRTPVLNWIAAGGATWQLLVSAHTGSALTLNFRGLECAGWWVHLLCFPLQAEFPCSSNAVALMAREKNYHVKVTLTRLHHMRFLDYVISIILQSVLPIVSPDFFFRQGLKNILLMKHIWGGGDFILLEVIVIWMFRILC